MPLMFSYFHFRMKLQMVDSLRHGILMMI